MALTTGTVSSVQIIKGADNSIVHLAMVWFTITGTYDSSLDSSLVGVPTLIQNSKRNGKTVTMVAVMPAAVGRKGSDNTEMWAKTAAISSADVTFTLVINADLTTEYTNSLAIPAMSAPIGIMVAYTEA